LEGRRLGLVCLDYARYGPDTKAHLACNLFRWTVMLMEIGAQRTRQAATLGLGEGRPWLLCVLRELVQATVKTRFLVGEDGIETSGLPAGISRRSVCSY
jgi:hypothetical protein